ncbi:MAG TPA: XdhC family protein [Pyrinomonadaceae bacterium]|nr:XdhC family protein [Pyrinomonadaceae bacterium]
MTETADEFDGAECLAGAIARVLEDGAVAVLATLVESPPPRRAGAKLLIDSSGEPATGGMQDPALDESIARRAVAFINSRAEAQTFKVEEFAPELANWRGARVLFERIEGEPRVVVCGAGHVGASLARLAGAVGYRVTLIDDRADFVARARFPDLRVELVEAREGWERAVQTVVGKGRGVYVAVVTRGHNEDEECMRAVVAARPDYVGMIGSRRRTNIVLERLRESGIGDEILREVRAPIGLDIGAVSPEEVALAVLAEIVAARRGGSGRPLSGWRRA